MRYEAQGVGRPIYGCEIFTRKYKLKFILGDSGRF